MSQRTLLVVEDDEDLRGMYRLTLSLAGYEVREAGNGFEALQRLDVVMPDAIVLDLYMPGLKGHAVLEELAAQAHTRQIPVVVVTASPEPVVYVNVACVLRKPVRPEQLVEAVQRCIASGSPPVV